ncbi:ABC transporter permease [Arthrobacter sp. 2RAF6]|uniref:ABC transporter permease n=1 Tax=Arthrobacter sp. 2RAF6 TaxID=3233002 RepID=UPI003F90150F
MMIALLVLRRLGAGIVLLLALSFLTFTLLSISPGSQIQVLLGTRPATPGLVEALTAKYNLGDPFIVQYAKWLGQIVSMDLGRSIAVQTDAPVTQIVGDRMGLTMQLAAYGLVFVLLVAVPLGMLAAIRRGRAADRGVTLAATVGISAPSFVVSIFLLYVFGVALGWFPIFGAGDGFAGRIYHLTLPAVALAIVLSAIVVRQTRAAMLTVMQQDYVAFARLRGLSPMRILVRYALRNAAMPVLTSLGIVLVAALSGALFIEQIFSLPGIGSLLLTAVTNKDLPVVQGAVLVLGSLVIVVNLGIDLIGLMVDPRTRFSMKGGA